VAVVTVFGGSHVKEGEPEYQIARELGKWLAGAGHTLCNGGQGGVMEASARGAKESSGKTIGVTAEELGSNVNRWIDEQIVVPKWRDRLFKLIEIGDTYIIFDGATGTLAELFVVWEMANKKYIQKPFIIFGRQMQDWVRQIQKSPQILNPTNLFFAKTMDEIIKVLKEKVHADASRF